MPPSPSAGSRLRTLVALLGALALLPLGVVLSAAPAQADPAATLTGSVTDGLDAQLAGVVVQAVDAGTLQDAAGADAQDTTDGTGAYSLSLETGTYKIRYSKSGYTSDWYGGEDAAVITIDAAGVASVENEVIEDGVLAPIALNSVATHTISGTAVKAGNVPLAGIRVDVYASDNHDDVIQSATTGSGGTFSLTVPEAVYHVQLTDTARHYLPRWYGGDGSAPDDVVLSANTPLGAITLAPVPAGAEFPIAGRVVDANDVSITGVQVTVAVAEGAGDSGSDTTGVDGEYSVSVLPGTYRVTFSGTGFQTRVYGIDGGSSLVTVAADGQLSTAPTEALTDNRLGEFTLPSTAYAKTGTVHEAVGGAVAPGVTVRAFPTDSNLPADIVDSTVTDTNGAYSLSLPIGTYHVQVVDLDGTAPDYQPTWIGAAVPVVVKVAQEGVLSVDGGTPVATLPDVQLSIASGATTYAVTGDVVDVNGDPVPSVMVAAAPQSGTPAENAVSTTADAAGHYVLPVKAGTYQITFAATDFLETKYSGTGTAPLDVVVSGTGAVTAGGVEAPGGALLEVELTGTATYQVTGTVQDATNDATVSGIHVTAHPTGDPSAIAGSGTTNASGAYSVTGLPIGTYTLAFADTDGIGVQYVGASFGGTPAAEVKIARGGGAIVGNTTVPGNNLGITKLARASVDTTYPVSGDLTDDNGEPIVGATVTAIPQTAVSQVTTTTDSDGHYVLALKAGTYRISYQAAAFTTAQYSNDAEPPVVVDIVVASSGAVTAGGTAVTGGGLEDVVLVGSDTHTVGGLVTDGSGTPLAGLTVKIYSSSDNSIALDATTTTASGYRFSGRRIGTYLIEVVGTSQYVGGWYLSSQTSTSATEVKIGQGSTIYSGGSPTTPNGTLSTMALAVVTADTTFVVSGEVTDVNGDGIAGVAVTATAIAGGLSAHTTAAADGQFAFDLKAGTYQISAAGNAEFAAGFLTPDDETKSSVVVAATVPNVTVDGEAVTDGVVGSITLAGKNSYPVTGTATNGTTGLPGITVEAFLSGSLTADGSTRTVASGAFALSLKIGTYTLRFTDETSNATRYQRTYFGGTPAKEVQVGQGGVVSVDGAAIGLTTVMSAVTADTAYDLAGTVYEPLEFDPLDGVTVTAIPVAGTPAANQRQGVTGPDPVLGDAGVYRVPVKAGKYQLRFVKSGYATAYLTDPEDPSKPLTVNVSTTGVISAPGLELLDGVIDDVQLLFPSAPFKTSPKLSGKVRVGQTVTASFGALQGAGIDKDYVIVEWFLNGKSADDYSAGNYSEKFKVPAAAATKKLSFRITIDDPDGMRTATVFTSKPVAVPKAAAKIKGAFKKKKFIVTVSVPMVAKPTGTLVVKDGKKIVAKVKLKAKSKGKVVVNLRKLKPGKHKLTLSYSGTKTVSAAKSKVKIKIQGKTKGKTKGKGKPGR